LVFRYQMFPTSNHCELHKWVQSHQQEVEQV
jgi:hypothetical protein